MKESDLGTVMLEQELEEDLAVTQKLPVLTPERAAEERIKWAARRFAVKVMRADEALVRMICRMEREGASEAERNERQEDHRQALLRAGKNEVKRLFFATKYKDDDAVEGVFLETLTEIGSSFMLSF